MTKPERKLVGEIESGNILQLEEVVDIFVLLSHCLKRSKGIYIISMQIFLERSKQTKVHKSV